ncbi:hypothetical protein Glove_99g267 [Diversispora epigaea]|uniref:Uncharacterized protein n=1 Tax=Diversispora epigaea TaxID=1348612 RepID=A0A397JD31_9GLOM|nr:hypothetical protein Glove_99g267 [Diversispora epigaea]
MRKLIFHPDEFLTPINCAEFENYEGILPLIDTSIKIIKDTQTNQRNHHFRTITLIEQFNHELFSTLQHITSEDIQNIIKAQINSVKLLPPILPTNIITDLPPNQYYCIQTIKTYLGPEELCNKQICSDNREMKARKLKTIPFC